MKTFISIVAASAFMISSFSVFAAPVNISGDYSRTTITGLDDEKYYTVTADTSCSSQSADAFIRAGGNSTVIPNGEHTVYIRGVAPENGSVTIEAAAGPGETVTIDNIEVNEGEVIALIGANGAGKTTILHTVTGLIAPKSGKIEFEGKDITKVPAHKIVSMGMAHVPEGRRVFAELSVYENLKLGAYTRKDKKEIEETLARVYKSFPRLEERKNQLAGTLSGGEQQMLAMGRALMSKPKIILMDEPSMGLSPILVEEIFHIIREISASGTTVLLVEQNAKKALAIADRAYVLETGNIVLSGDAKEMMNNDSIKKAYLGE